MLACPAEDVSEMEHLEMSVPDRNYKHVLRLRGDGEEKKKVFFFFFFLNLRRPCFASCFWAVPVWMHIHSSWAGCAGVRWSGDEGQENRSREPAPWASYTRCSPTGLIMTTRTTRMGSLLAWECAPDSFKSLIYTSSFEDAWQIGCNTSPAHGILTCYF